MSRARPTQSPRAFATAQGMADARALEGIVARAVDGVPIEADRALLLAIGDRLPAAFRAQIAALFAKEAAGARA